jgi:hypothetical protein
MWTRVRFLTSKKMLIVIVQVSQESKPAWCYKLHNPLVDTDAYVDSSDVSLAVYLCTHGCLIYFCRGDFSFTTDIYDEFDVDGLAWESQTEVWFLWRVL